MTADHTEFVVQSQLLFTEVPAPPKGQGPIPLLKEQEQKPTLLPEVPEAIIQVPTDHHLQPDRQEPPPEVAVLPDQQEEDVVTNKYI